MSEPNNATLIRNNSRIGSTSNSATNVNYNNADGTKISVQDKINELKNDIDHVIVPITQAEYDALPSTKTSDNLNYLITDADDMDAYNMPYKNTTVGDVLNGLIKVVRFKDTTAVTLPAGQGNSVSVLPYIPKNYKVITGHIYSCEPANYIAQVVSSVTNENTLITYVNRFTSTLPFTSFTYEIICIREDVYNV